MIWRRNTDDAIECRQNGLLVGGIWKRRDLYTAAVYNPYKILGQYKKKEAMKKVEDEYVNRIADRIDAD